MRVVIITEEPSHPGCLAIEASLIEAGIEVDFLHGPQMLMENANPDYQVGIGLFRSHERPTPEPPMAWYGAVALRGVGVPILNALDAHQRAFNKLIAYVMFGQSGIPQPATRILDELSLEDGNSLSLFSVDHMIVGPMEGSLGSGIKVSNLTDARRIQDHLGRLCLVREYIPGRYLRLICTPERTIRAYELHSLEAGSRFEIVEVDTRVAELGQIMVASVGGTLMGADIVVEESGELWALEVSPTFEFDIQDKIIGEAFVEECRKLTHEFPREAEAEEIDGQGSLL